MNRILTVMMAIAGMVVSADAATITGVTAKQRYPWNGKVDVTYTVTGDLGAGLPPDKMPGVLLLSATNRVAGTNYVADMGCVSGDTGTAEGAHHVVWDLNAQGLEFKSEDVVFTVAYRDKPKPYCVIDLSAGADASSYTVSYLVDVPSGGWTDEYKTTKLVLRLIEPGSFMMGGQYQVTLTKPFYCGVFVVTQRQWELVMGSNPCSSTLYGKGNSYPVHCVSYNMIRGSSNGTQWPSSSVVDASSFVGKLQARTGLNLDLPTEAQWEYACRAGTATTYYWGNSMDDGYCWYSGNSSSTTHPVGSKTSNAWGLYDMSGNVWEWCLDRYGSLTSGVTDPTGSSSGSGRVLRGGWWNVDADYCTSSTRAGSPPSNEGNGYGGLGVRLVRTLSSTDGGQSPEVAAGTILCVGGSATVTIDSRVDVEPVLDSVGLSWNASWIGGDAGATVVITDNGTEVKRTTGTGEFTHEFSDIGRHELTYTTYIGGVAQDEAYTAVVKVQWMYEIENGGASIRWSPLRTGAVEIPSEIDGCPVTGIGNGVFAGCSNLTEVVIPGSVWSIGEGAFAECANLRRVEAPRGLMSTIEANDIFAGCSSDLEIVYVSAEITNVTAKQRYPWNGKVDITYTLTGDVTVGLSSDRMPVLLLSATNCVAGASYVADLGCVSGDVGTAEGTHHIVWDLNAQGIEFKSDDVVFTVAYVLPLYRVIDLSGGPDASSYPVSYVADAPSGGWTDEYKTTKLVLRLIEPGTFMMGGSYQVTLTKPFYCGVFEVTQKQYELVTGSNPSSYKGDMRPVEYVSWNTIRGNSGTYNWPNSTNVNSSTFIGKLQARTGLNLDLPTEAQWEYACRAGTTSAYNNGGDTEDDLKQLGRYVGNTSDGKGGYSQHTIVGLYLPNKWGLYDMHGNVWEWCLDWYGNLSSGVSDPLGPSSGSYRIVRAGTWTYGSASDYASSIRFKNSPSGTYSDGGFRLSQTLSGEFVGANLDNVLCFGDSVSVMIDSRVDIEPVLDSVTVTWDTSWFGGDSDATVVIADNGAEVKSATGAGEFTHTLAGDGRHELTYTTYIGDVAQDEVYTATVYKNWTCNISDVTAKQRYPWNGKVDITYTLTGDVTVGFSPEAEIVLFVTASNRVDGTTYAAAASALSGDTGTAEGAHHVVWDLNAQGIEFVSDDVLFAVAYVPVMRYCVVDLSGGASASSYPVTYVASVPSGGFNTDEYKTTKLVLRLIEPGTFMMGGSYQVTLTKPFYCGVFEVTQKQYELVTGSNPCSSTSYGKGDSYPVHYVSYNMIRGSSAGAGWPGSSAVDGGSFLGKLQARTGLNFDLPTEAQWEYACRAGTTTTYSCGNSADGNYMWYSSNSSSKSHVVGTKQPNAWGLYDMHGNVWEWCLDWNGNLASGVTDPVGSSSGSDRVLRGGGWYYDADRCTSSYRYNFSPSHEYSDGGFRLARTLLGTNGEYSPEAVAGAERADVLCAAEAAPVAIDSRVDVEPVLDSVVVAWDAAWIGGDANATVVIADNGTEVKRTTGAGEFALPGIGRHELTYTTYIGGVAQDEVYTATVYAKWKYEVVDGGAVITETTQTSGVVTIPAEIDGYPVRDIADGLFDGCTGVRNVTIPANLLVKEGAAGPANEWTLSPNGWKVLSEKDGEYQSATIGNNGSTSMSLELTGPYELSFDWKVSSEGNYDYLRWSLDGTENTKISGTGGDWQTVTYSIPDGKHTVTWSYTKDSSQSSGDDCGWVRVKNTPGGMSGVSYGSICELFPDSYAAIQSVTLTGAATEIPTDAFAGCASLTSVAIPNSVTRIGPGAFDGCTALTHLDLPAGLTDWGLASLPPAMREGHTYDANGLMIVDGWLLDCQDKTHSSLTLPEGVVGIGSYALADMYDMETVNLPQSLKYIAEGAFCGDSYLDNLVLPAGVETIAPNAFEDCSYLQNLVPIKGVRTVGARAFAGCTQLSGVTFGEGLVEIGAEAFDGCWRMLSASLPLSVTNVASSAFRGCTSLTGVTTPTHGGKMSEWFAPVYSQIRDVTVPEGETEVRASMFEGCGSLRTVQMPDPITNIAARAFYGCSSLPEVRLPESLLTVGDEAFRNCSSLTAAALPENVMRIGARAYQGCSNLSALTLPRGLEALPDYVFADCWSLDSFVVPAAVTKLGNYIVSGSTTAIYYLGNAPAYGANVYGNASGSLKSYVILGTKGWDGRPNSRDIPASWNGRDILTWSANRFDVTFDANGGLFFPVVTNTYACEETTYTGYSLPPFEPVRKGMDFAGYWTEPGGGTRVFTSTRVLLTKPHTLYAHWKKGTTIKVRFNACGGTVSPAEDDYVAERPYCELPVPVREHFAFAGWWTEASGGSRVEISSEVPKAAHELFAHWTPCRYTIRFHANNGTGATVDQSFTYGQTVTLRANTFVREGNAFAGWALSEDGPAVYADKKTLTDLAAIQDNVIHLYAVWVSTRYAVRFDSHGGVGRMDNQTLVKDEGAPLNACTFTRTGYTFAGWAVSTTGDVVYGDGENVVNVYEETGADVVLYAVWEPISYSVHYSANGGSGSMDDQRMTYDETVALSTSQFANNGAWFRGWSVKVGGAAAYMDGERVRNLSAIADDVVTFYAVWQEKPASVLVCEDAFGGAGVVTLDANDNIVVTLTNDVNGTVEIPDNVGTVIIDLNGHNMVGDGGFIETALPGPAIRIVAGEGEGETTNLAIGDTSDGEKGQIAGGGESAGIEIAEDAAHGVRLDVDDAVPVLNGDGTEQDCSQLGKGYPPWPVDGAYNPLVANVYDGYIVDDDGALAGIIQVKAAKQAVKTVTDKVTKEKTVTTNVAVTATVTDAAGKKWSYSKGVGTVDGAVTGLVCTTKGVLVPSFDVTLGANGLEGEWGDFAVEGARNGMGTKGDAMMAVLDAYYKKSWSVTLTNGLGATRLQLMVGAKGSTKISGVTPDGYKISATVQGIMGEDAFFVPYLATLKNGKLTRSANLLLTLGKDGTVVARTSDLGGLKAAGPTTDEIEVQPYAESESSKGGEAYAGAVVLNELAYPAKFAAKGLPAGLKIDAATGAITGIPTKPGRYTATITVTSGVNSKKKVETKVDFVIGNYTDEAIDIEDSYSGYCVGVMVCERIAAALDCAVSGLPAGLKFAAKETKDNTFGMVAAGTVYGVPTKAGEYTVYFKKTEKVNGKSVNHQASATFRVEALPEWAQGTFDGHAGRVTIPDGEEGGDQGESGGHGVTALPSGMVTVTVDAKGKISGKLIDADGTWTLSAAAYERVEGLELDNQDDLGSLGNLDDLVFHATVIGKNGKKAITNEVTVALDEAACAARPPYRRGVVTGGSQSSAAAAAGDSRPPEWTAWQNLWKTEPWKTDAKTYAKAPKLTVGEIELKFGSSGAVTAKYGKYSCSTVLIPAEAGTFSVFLYFPPKAGKFDGYGVEISLTWDADGKKFSAVEQ